MNILLLKSNHLTKNVFAYCANSLIFLSKFKGYIFWYSLKTLLPLIKIWVHNLRPVGEAVNVKRKIPLIQKGGIMANISPSSRMMIGAVIHFYRTLIHAIPVTVSRLNRQRFTSNAHERWLFSAENKKNPVR